MTVRTMRIHVNKEVSGVDSLAQQVLALPDRPSSLLRQINLLVIFIVKIMKTMIMVMSLDTGDMLGGKSTRVNIKLNTPLLASTLN